MKCPHLVVVDSMQRRKFDDCIEEECAWWLKTPSACAKKVQAMQIGELVKQLRLVNVHLAQIEKGVYP